MKVFLILIGLSLFLPVRAADFYVGQTATGNGSGTDASNCQSVAWFNAPASWGTGAGQIGPGTTIHLVGTISTNLLPRGSGLPGAPITLYFEPDAKLSASAFVFTNFAQRWINLNGLHDYVIDGGVNGVIENLNCGTDGAQAGVEAIRCDDAADLEVKNLTFRNLYVHTSTNDDNGGGGAITGNGFKTNAFIHNCTFSNICWVIGLCGPNGGNEPAGQGGGNINIYSNVFLNYDHGVADLGGYTNVNIYANQFGTTANWDTTSGTWHHDGIHIFFDTSGGVADVKIHHNLFDGDWGINNTANIFLQGNFYQSNMQAISNLWIYNNVFNITPNHNLNNGHIAGNAVDSGVFNNSFIDGNTYAIAMIWTAFRGQVVNNLFSGQGIFFWLNQTGITNYQSLYPQTFNNNLYTFYLTPSRGLAWMFGGGWSGFSPSQWPGWLAFSKETNSLYLGTVSAGVNADGTLQDGSLAIGAGANLTALNLPGLNTDFDGNPRPASGAWDIGAFQHQVSLPLGVATGIAVTPASLNFGSLLTGTATNLSFTVQNTNVGTGILSGSASVSAPFSIVSGGSYNLAAGQTQVVTVAYSPTVTGTNVQTVTFSGGGGATTTVSGIAKPVPPQGLRVQATPANAPLFASELGSGWDVNGGNTITIKLTNSVSAGQIVAVAFDVQASQPPVVAAIGDSQGNTYFLAKSASLSSAYLNVAIYYSVITHPLSPSDTITISFNSLAYCYRYYWACSVANASGLDTTAANTGSGSSVSIPATASSPAVILGAFAGASYTGGNFNLIDQVPVSQAKFWCLQQPVTSAGTQDMGGSTTLWAGWAGCWASFK